MWWSDNISHVYEVLGEGYRIWVLDSPLGLHSLLGNPSVLVQECGFGYDQACAIIAFESDIDIEHGIGVLTDGQKVIGVGYATDTEAFSEFATN